MTSSSLGYLLHIPGWLTLLVEFILVFHFWKQWKEYEMQSGNRISTVLTRLYIIVIFCAIAYSISIIIRLFVCDPTKQTEPTLNDTVSLKWIDLFRGFAIYGVFIGQASFYLSRLHTTFKNSIYEIKKCILYILISIMIIASICFHLGWITYVVMSFKDLNMVTLGILITVGTVLSICVTCMIDYLFVQKLLLLIDMDSHQLNIFQQISKHIHFESRNNKHTINITAPPIHLTNLSDSNSYMPQNIDSKSAAVIVAGKSPSIGATAVTTPRAVSVDIDEIIGPTDEIDLSQRQKELVSAINKQTLLVFIGLKPLLVSFALKMVIVIIDPNMYFTSYHIDFSGIITYVVDPIGFFIACLCLYLSFAFANKEYQTLCNKLDKYWGKCWIKAAQMRVVEVVRKMYTEKRQQEKIASVTTNVNSN